MHRPAAYKRREIAGMRTCRLRKEFVDGRGITCYRCQSTLALALVRYVRGFLLGRRCRLPSHFTAVGRFHIAGFHIAGFGGGGHEQIRLRRRRWGAAYFVAGGGGELRWAGVSAMADVSDPKSDYGRACAATGPGKWMAAIPVGTSRALVFSDPPMTAWGTSADGFTDIYMVMGISQSTPDALIARASGASATAAMQPTGVRLTFTQPDGYLMYAGDAVPSHVYPLVRVPIAPGTYDVLTATYSANAESVIVYRLVPLKR